MNKINLDINLDVDSFLNELNIKMADIRNISDMSDKYLNNIDISLNTFSDNIIQAGVNKFENITKDLFDDKFLNSKNSLYDIGGLISSLSNGEDKVIVDTLIKDLKQKGADVIMSPLNGTLNGLVKDLNFDNVLQQDFSNIIKDTLNFNDGFLKDLNLSDKILDIDNLTNFMLEKFPTEEIMNKIENVWGEVNNLTEKLGTNLQGIIEDPVQFVKDKLSQFSDIDNVKDVVNDLISGTQIGDMLNNIQGVIGPYMGIANQILGLFSKGTEPVPQKFW